jgi:electron transport complex protein RnfC
MNGVVGGVGQVTLTSGRDAPAVALEALSESDVPHRPAPTTADDGFERLAALLRDAETADLSHFIDRLRLAGVWADRWTSPDLLGQLYQALKRPVDTVICSALDFDDAVPLQQTVARDQALPVVAAVATLAAAMRAKQAVVVVDAATGDTAARAIGHWMSLTPVRTVSLRNSYPQPNPTLLLYTLARRKLRPGRLPTEGGVLVLDAVAAAAAGRCLLYGEPLLNTPLGIADMRGENVRTHLLTAPVGMSVADVLREAGAAPGAFELRGGSPLREIRLGADCVISAGGEVALYVVAPQPHVIPAPCIRCGWCVSGCPVHIHPAGLLEAAQAQDPVRADRFGLESCIECGVCSYVCPSHLPLLGGIRSLRAVRS